MSKLENAPVITLDGPGGVGKGTLSVLLAQHLNWHILDSGALYRVLAYAAQQAGLGLDEEEAIAALASQLDLEFQAHFDASTQMPDVTRIILAAKDVTLAVRSEAGGSAASQIAALPQVRAALLQYQRDFCRPPGLIADGRDMGTVVFPAARLKVFLLASPEERAQRRYKQLKQKGISARLADLVKALAERDKRDLERQASPLLAASDAIQIDTTALSIHEVLAQIRQHVDKEFS